MQNLKFSDYIITVWDKGSEQYHAVQSYLGNFDKFTYAIGKKLAQKDYGILNEPVDTVNYLRKRGYLCEAGKDESLWFQRIADILHKKASEHLQVSIIPTYDCNFRCPYCYEGSNKKHKTMDGLMISQIYRALDQYHMKLNQNICLFGGEPLLAENFYIIQKIVKEGSKRGYRFFAASNGFELDAYEELLNPAYIYRIQTTLDGTEEYHDAVRYLKGKKPTFQTIVKQINHLLEKRVEVIVRTNVSKKNLGELDKLIYFYKEQNWISNPCFRFYFSPLDDCKEVLGNQFVTPVDIYSYIEESNQFPVKPVEMVGVYKNLYSRMKKLKESGKMLLLQAEACQSNRNGIYIDPYGSIYTCCNLVGTKYVCGKIQNSKLRMNGFFHEWNERTVFKIEKCRTCEYAFFCGGGCTAKLVRKDRDIMDGNCANMKEIIRECIKNL